MHDEIEVIEQDPAGAVAAFDMRRLRALRSERVLDRIRDRLNLACVLARHDHEVIREALGRTEIEHHDFGSLAILSRLDGALDLCGKRAGGFFAWGHSTAATVAGTYRRCRWM